KDKIVVIELRIKRFVLIKFIVDFTYNFFQDILQRHNARRTAVFIHDNGQVHLLFLEFLQKVVDLFAFGNKIRRTQQVLPAETGGALIQVGQQVLDVQN